MFGRKREAPPPVGTNLAPSYSRPEAPPAPPIQRIHTTDLLGRLDEFDNVLVFPISSAPPEKRWVCNLEIGKASEAGEIKFQGRGASLEAAVADGLAKADAARRRLR